MPACPSPPVHQTDRPIPKAERQSLVRDVDSCLSRESQIWSTHSASCILSSRKLDWKLQGKVPRVTASRNWWPPGSYMTASHCLAGHQILPRFWRIGTFSSFPRWKKDLELLLWKLWLPVFPS